MKKDSLQAPDGINLGENDLKWKGKGASKQGKTTTKTV